MITNEDVQKLKKVFVTKEDMEKLKKVFVTKVEFEELRSEVMELRSDFNEFKELVMQSFDTLFARIDRFLGMTEAVQVDNSAGAQILYRHSIQIRALADGTGITIPEE